jgi:regulator of protease activity HflC (stomatin/prohibitin superfamily)
MNVADQGSDGTALLALLTIVTLAMAVAVTRLWRRYRHPVLVPEHTTGMLQRDGVFVRMLAPGRHRIDRVRERVIHVGLRTRVLQVRGQEVLTSDGIAVKVSLDVELRVVDARLAVSAAEATGGSYAMAGGLGATDLLQLRTSSEIRSAVAGLDLDGLLADYAPVAAQVRAQVAGRAAELGLEVEGVIVRDVMLPAPVKKMLAAAVQARVEGLAALERARAEHATMRSLANTARLMEQHPALGQIRMIQEMANSERPTFVVGVEPAAAVATTPAD